MSENEYNTRKMSISDEIDRLILKRTAAGWSFFKKELRSAKAIQIQAEIDQLRAEKEKLVEEYKKCRCG